MPTDVAGVIVDGQAVYYRPDEVIAVGEAAREFVLRRREEQREHGHDDPEEPGRDEELVRLYPQPLYEVLERDALVRTLVVKLDSHGDLSSPSYIPGS